MQGSRRHRHRWRNRAHQANQSTHKHEAEVWELFYQATEDYLRTCLPGSRVVSTEKDWYLNVPLILVDGLLHAKLSSIGGNTDSMHIFTLDALCGLRVADDEFPARKKRPMKSVQDKVLPSSLATDSRDL